MSVNKAIIKGRLGKDVELRYAASGKEIANFSIATSEKYNGEEKTEWHNIVAFGKQAEVLSKYVSKGDELYIEGKIQHRSYDDRDGNKKYVTEIVVMQFDFCGSQKGNDRTKNENTRSGNENSGGVPGGPPFGTAGGDIPF